MVYNPVTDFIALWRNGGTVSKLEMPGLDYVVAALARAGMITLSVSATAPVVNQSVTAWLQAAVPSNSAEGVLRLWNPVTSAYIAATPALLFDMLQAAAGQNGVSWWTTTGGAPLNTVGNNGDFAIRTDEPGGIYGPKALGAWPVSPIAGTTDIVSSTQLDLTFGSSVGQLITRGPAVWQSVGIGAANSVLTSLGGLPGWDAVSALLDTLFSSVRGSMLFRGAAAWSALGPGTANQVLATGGPGADPAWAPRTAEFPAGTIMLFQQTAAPTGWTKSVAVNDYGLRVVSGAVGAVAGSAFSTVFAQSAVGNTTLSVTQIPPHSHGVPIPDFPTQVGAGTSGGGLAYSSAAARSYATDNGTGGGLPHNHTVNLTLAYLDVIIASKN